MKKIQLLMFALLTMLTVLHAKSDSLAKAYFAGGCFWGVEYHLESLKGVKSVISGFMGGHVAHPSYQDVVYKNTGHIETVEVSYDPTIIRYETIAKHFFEIHDFTDVGGQGPDRGKQYESYIFYTTDTEEDIAKKLIQKLSNMGYKVATQIQKATPFYKAEGYHQDYYQRHNKVPYCHAYNKIFKE